MPTINDMVRDALRASEVMEDARQESQKLAGDAGDGSAVLDDLDGLEADIEKAAVELDGERADVTTADEPAGADPKPQGGDHPDIGPQSTPTPDPGPPPQDPEVSTGDQPAPQTPGKQPDEEDPAAVGPDHVHKTADEGDGDEDEDQNEDDAEDGDGADDEEETEKAATDDDAQTQKIAEKVVEFLLTKAAIDQELAKVAGPGRGAAAAGAGLLGLLGGGLAGHAVAERDDASQMEAAYMAGIDDLANALMAEQIAGAYGGPSANAGFGLAGPTAATPGK